MKKTERFIGACSKYIDKVGWTTDIPVDQINEKGYVKVENGSVVLSKEEYQELEELRLNHAKDLINANKLYEERIADLKIEFSNHIKNLERKIDRRDRDLNSQADRLINLKEELSQARKETAEEILLKYHVKFTPKEVDEIIKQYGVEE